MRPTPLTAAASEIQRLALVLLDLDCTTRGIALLTALEIAHIPTLALTSAPDATLHALATKHGAVDCVTKPISVGWLQRALDYLAPVPAETPLGLAA